MNKWGYSLYSQTFSFVTYDRTFEYLNSDIITILNLEFDLSARLIH